MVLRLLLVLASVGIVAGQSCTNYGTLLSNGTCACPPGLTGDDCSLLACSNPLLPSSSRTTFSYSGSSNASQGCTSQCSDGFGGPTCNVCRNAGACSAAMGNSGISTTSSTLGSPVCSTGPWTWTEGFASCDVVNPTLQDVFSGSTTLTIQKTVEPTQSLSSPFGSNGTLLAQLWYAPSTDNTTLVEQFYCAADTCTQTNITSSSSSVADTVDWSCANLQCTCIAGTSFCGKAGEQIDITDTINGLSGTLDISCDKATGESCSFKQSTLKTLFGKEGLALSSCSWGECVLPATINSLSTNLVGGTSNDNGSSGLSTGVIAGLAVLGALVGAILLLLLFGYIRQRQARNLALNTDSQRLIGSSSLPPSSSSGSSALVDSDKPDFSPPPAVGIRWNNLSYSLPPPSRFSFLPFKGPASDGKSAAVDDGRLVLSSLTATVEGGSFCSILGPSGAGKSTLVDLLAGVRKTGYRGGSVELIVPTGAAAGSEEKVRVGYVDQNDVLPETSTVREAVTFAARLKLGEIPKERMNERVFEVLTQLGLLDVADSIIGSADSSGKRGISGGERRRVSIARELVARPAVLILDEATSGLDSSSALRIIQALKTLTIPTADRRATTVLLTIHQPSSQLFQLFDDVLLLSHSGEQMYFGRKEDVEDWFVSKGTECPRGFSISDYMLDLASAPLSQMPRKSSLAPPAPDVSPSTSPKLGMGAFPRRRSSAIPTILLKNDNAHAAAEGRPRATGLTQVQVLMGRGGRELLRDKSLILTHNVVPLIVGLIVGGMFYQVDTSIGGFQSRIGSLFFLGCLIAFSSLSALTHFSKAKALFVRERARGYYHSLCWLASTVVLDVVPLRIVPTILLGVIVYFMVGLSSTAAHFFKFLLILLLYTITTTLWNFFLAAAFTDVGVAILVSSILNLFQLAYAGFFLNLSRIPPVLRWLQYLAPLKFALEALAVNEVGAGLMINDSLEGARVSVSAELIMDTLFGFKATAYYRDVLVLVAFIVGFAVLLTGAVLLKLRELR